VRLNKNKSSDEEAVQLDWLIDEQEMFSFSSEKFEDVIIPLKLVDLKVIAILRKFISSSSFLPVTFLHGMNFCSSIF
jgi:hypothetical protein